MTTNPANDTRWLRELFERSPDAIVVMDDKGAIIEANGALLRITGLQRDAVLGRRLDDLIPVNYRAKWQHDLAMLTTGKWDVMEGCIANDDGRRISPVEVTLVSRCDHEGRPATILHMHDTSIYHSVEKALVASREEWELSFDAITDCMFVLERNGRILRANRAARELFNLDPAAPTLVQDILSSPLDGRSPPMPHPVGDAPFSSDKQAFEGREGWYAVTAYPLENERGVRTGAVLILRNITEQIETGETLRKIENGMRQTAKMEAIGRLAGGIAHDFNNMLTSVLGYSSMMLKTLPPDSELCDDVHEIIKAAERATALTRQLLNFSHERKIETQPLDINTVVRGLKTFISRTIGENIELHTSLDEGLHNVDADISRIEQIIINLAINARDAMPGGGRLMIETANFQADRRFCMSHPGIRQDHYVLLEISDTGNGMPPHVLEHIFEPFFTTKERGKGTGLGLTTIYGIVKQLNGIIQCYSEPGQGTSFKIYLPRVKQAVQAAADETGLTELHRGHETILVVDDEANIVTMIEQILTELGYRVLSASSCEQAQAVSDAHPEDIDLILTDIIMPRMNGMQLAACLQQKRPRLKALYMSGYADQAAAQIGGLGAGAVFLQKPFSFDIMAKRVRQALAGQSGKPAAAAPASPASNNATTLHNERKT